MRKLIGLIFTLLVCGLMAPQPVADGGAERSASEAVCAVAATIDSSTVHHHALAAAEDGSLALQRLLDEVAVIVPRADMAAGKTSAKNDCGKWCRGFEGRLRGCMCGDTGGVVACCSHVTAFTRAIDHYVYAFRHIII